MAMGMGPPAPGPAPMGPPGAGDMQKTMMEAYYAQIQGDA